VNPEPQRIQLRRTKGWRKPEGAIVVARPTRWGNPYKVGQERGGIPMSRLAAVAGFSREARYSPARRTGAFGRYPTRHDIMDLLAGADLACWCRPADLCHADVLLDIANPLLPSIDWLVTIGTKSAIVAAPNLTVAALKVGGHTARPATADEVTAWHECRDLTSALGRARTVAARRELLGITDPDDMRADYDVPLFAP
jgi:hypothetical protein